MKGRALNVEQPHVHCKLSLHSVFIFIIIAECLRSHRAVQPYFSFESDHLVSILEFGPETAQLFSFAAHFAVVWRGNGWEHGSVSAIRMHIHNATQTQHFISNNNGRDSGRIVAGRISI